MKKLKTQTYLLAGDFQCPHHDPEAVEIVCQIGEELRGTPTKLSLCLMGDFLDFSQIGKYPTRVMEDLKESHERANTVLGQLVDHVKPNGRRIWLDGNHEDRLIRTMVSQPQIAQVLSLPSVSNAVAIPNLMRLPERKFEYVGVYGYATFIPKDAKDGDRSHSIYLEHGRYVSQKAGYTAHRHMAQNAIGTAVGHVHRMAAVWQSVPGLGGDNVRFLSVECGTMSLLGVPGKGDNLYGSVPHRNPQIMNTQQGFVVLTLDEYKEWHAEMVNIHRGTAFFRGRIYSAVTKKRAMTGGR